jgi:hypothetical protein
MAEDADSEYQKLLWDAALESMGRDTVRIRLNNMPADRSATFKLPGQRSCKRGYAEDWLGRGDAKEKALEARHHRCARHCGRCRCSGHRMARDAGLDQLALRLSTTGKTT